MHSGFMLVIDFDIITELTQNSTLIFVIIGFFFRIIHKLFIFPNFTYLIERDSNPVALSNCDLKIDEHCREYNLGTYQRPGYKTTIVQPYLSQL